MFTCGKCKHKHDTVHEARVCYGILEALTTTAPALRDRAGSMSHSQELYLRSLGATDRHLRDAHNSRLSMALASALIDAFKKGMVKDMAVTTEQAEFAKGMFPSIPSGYFCVPLPSEADRLFFVRVSRPKFGRHKGNQRLQIQSGNSLMPAAVLFESGAWWQSSPRAPEIVLILVADYQGAAVRYARERKKCARCNSDLTDPRSRHYGIGPECETYWPWFIEAVNASEGAFA